MLIKKNSYLFIDNLNENIDKKINKFKNLSIICGSRNKDSLNHNEIEFLRKFCKRKKIKFYYKDNIKMANKYKADGIYLSNENKKSYKNLNNKKFNIIGLAHNQLEYFTKFKQGCEMIMLSPLFHNKKYSTNKILGVIKFNLMTKNWGCQVGALAGILKKNLKKTNMIKAKSIGFIRLIEEGI